MLRNAEAHKTSDAAAPHDWEGRLLITLAAIRGLALTEHFEPRARISPDPRPVARATLLAGLKAETST